MNKRVLITGSTDGIGKQTALKLADIGYEVWLHGKNYDKLENARDFIIENTNNENVFGIAADFTSLQQVKKMSIELRHAVDSLDIIINNAGIINSVYEKTVDGFESVFQVNYLSHFLLTQDLLPLMKGVASGRIINVASKIYSKMFDKHNLYPLNADDFVANKVYSDTKLYNILFTFKLARMLKGSNIIANCLHPGVIDTKLLRSSFGDIGSPVEYGSDTSVYLASSYDIETVSGRYFSNKRIEKVSEICYDRDVQDLLWNKSLELLRNYLQ